MGKKGQGAATPGVLELQAAGVAFKLLSYDYDKGDNGIAMEAARQVGVAPADLFKTLVICTPIGAAMALAPADTQVSMKKAAKVLGVKSAEMARPALAERLTGYKVGGVSPFGLKKRLPLVIDETALLRDELVINVGRRGLLVRLAVADIEKLLTPLFANVTLDQEG